MMSKLRYYLKKLINSENGVSIVSLALVFIFVFVPLIIGVVEITDGFTVKRRVKAAAHYISDITAKTSTQCIQRSQVASLYQVVNETLEPYISNGSSVPTIILREISRDEDNVLSQEWRCTISSVGATCVNGGDTSDIDFTFFSSTDSDVKSDSPIGNPRFIVGYVQYIYSSPFTVYHLNTPLEHTTIIPKRDNDPFEIEDSC